MNEWNYPLSTFHRAYIGLCAEPDGYKYHPDQDTKSETGAGERCISPNDSYATEERQIKEKKKIKNNTYQ